MSRTSRTPRLAAPSRAAALCAAALLLLQAGASAGASRTGAFAPADPGVRAAAMGGAFTALGGEPSALYWNPAALHYQTGRSVEASYADLYGLGLARRTSLTFGTKAVYDVPRFVRDRVEVRRDTASGPGYAFGVQSLFVDVDGGGYSEIAVGGGAAWSYGDRLAAGVSLRGLFVSSDFEDVSAIGYDLGLGIGWQYSSRERIALAVPHLMSRLFWRFDSTERLPLGVAAGWSRRLGAHATVSADAELREGEDSPYRLAVGAEVWIVPQRLALRGGYRRLDGGSETLAKPTFGAGVRFSRLRLDYAYRLEHEALGDSHRLGLLAGF